jgi:hypothetical protein
MTSDEKIDKSVLRYLKKIDDKVERLEKLIKKLECYDENRRPAKKRSSAYNEFVKTNWRHPAFQNLDSLSRMSAIGLAWTNQKRNTKNQNFLYF